MATPKLIYYLENLTDTRKSAVLMEKLGALYQAQGETDKAIKAFKEVLHLNPTPQQRVRVTLDWCGWLAHNQQEAAAFDGLQKFLKEFNDYPDKLSIYQKLLPLARALNKSADASRYQVLIDRLASAPARP